MSYCPVCNDKITDIHPDTWRAVRSEFDTSCHKKDHEFCLFYADLFPSNIEYKLDLYDLKLSIYSNNFDDRTSISKLIHLNSENTRPYTSFIMEISYFTPIKDAAKRL